MIDLNEVRARQEKADQVVSDLCHGRRRWDMHIPARPDQDPDLIISAALGDVLQLANEVKDLYRQLAHARFAIEAVEWHWDHETGNLSCHWCGVVGEWQPTAAEPKFVVEHRPDCLRQKVLKGGEK